MSETYIEPGVYVTDQKKQVSQSANAAVKMYPLIIGRIPRSLPAVLNITRTSGGDGSVPFDAIDSSYASLTDIDTIRATYNSSKKYKKSYVKLAEDSATGTVGFKWATGAIRYDEYRTSKFALIEDAAKVTADWGAKTNGTFYHNSIWMSPDNTGKHTRFSVNAETTVSLLDTNISFNDFKSKAIIEKRTGVSDGTPVWTEIVLPDGEEAPIEWLTLDTLLSTCCNGFRYKENENAPYVEVLLKPKFTPGETLIYEIGSSDSRTLTSKGQIEALFDGKTIAGGTEDVIKEATATVTDYETGEYGVLRKYSTDEVDITGDVPALGSIYTIKFTFIPVAESKYYDLQEWTIDSGISDIEAFYGKESTAVDYALNGVGYNPIPLAANILYESGCRNFFTVAIPEEDVAYVKDENGKFLTYSNEQWVEATSPSDYMILATGTYNQGTINVTATHTYEMKNEKYVTVTGELIGATIINNSPFLKNDKIYRIKEDTTFAGAISTVLYQKCAGIEAEQLYRIVPLVQGDGIISAVKAFADDFSSPEERAECGTFVSLENAFDSYDSYMEAVKAKASSLASSRVVLSYGEGLRDLKDGQEALLNTQYILTYLAGAESIKKDGTGLTNLTIPLTTFKTLNVKPMRRTEKNAIAECGVLVLDQRPQTAAIKVRHGITTYRNDKYGKETSVQRNIDYSKKYLRAICNPYIGQTNVNPEVINLVSTTLEDGLVTLVKEGWLVSASLQNIAVADNAPDTLVVTILAKVAFPLNYIFIELVLD